jgi:hypothetical protein
VRSAVAIFCNDKIEHVVLPKPATGEMPYDQRWQEAEAKAREIIGELAALDYEKHYRWTLDWTEYRMRCYWHTHDVAVTEL